MNEENARHNPFANRDSPFAAWIEAEKTDRAFKIPNLAIYTGVDNPEAHVRKYRILLKLNRATEHVLCKMFVTTLGGPAYGWFQSLPPGSINNFDQLSREFCAKFAGCIPPVVKSGKLFELKQKANESLREYVDTFNQLCIQIIDVDISVAVECFVRNTTCKSLQEDLMRKKPTSMAELMERCKDFIEVDDIRRGSQSSPKKDKGESRHRDRHKDKHQDSSSRSRQRGSKNKSTFVTSFTPLNASKSEVLMWIENSQHKRSISYPEPKGGEYTNTAKNPKNYCKYHRKNGHDTDACWELAREIERLIERGKFDRFIQNDGKKGDGDRSKEDPKKKGKGTINVIAGGPRYQPMLKKAKTTALDRASLNRLFADVGPEISPHADALVVTMMVEGWEMKRVMVDTGSSCNIITRGAFAKLMIDPVQVEPTVVDILGVTGHTIQTKGQVTLDCELTDDDQIWKGELEFSVLDGQLAYNIILGRPFISEVAALISIRHLTLYIPTTKGGVMIRGSQKVAQETYSASLTIRPQSKEEDDEELVTMALGETEMYLMTDEKQVRMAKGLKGEIKNAITKVLREAEDVFAWKDEILPGISPDVITHKLNIDKDAVPVAQKRRNHGPERQKVIEEEITKLH
ncbi:uncharacterized protein [Euphorbia lathyris]|uniref:uncharacterized protein n=1 Tax=Euphorbia lathyris TaxID=212925 RepID=UPI003313A0A8